jgi:hypothetical protein
MAQEATKVYPAFFFRQRPSAPVQCSFAATSADISDWASVPEKTTDELRNFQRPEIQKHIGEIHEFFEKFDENSSPTAIVVGFRLPDKVQCFRELDGKRVAIDLDAVQPGEIVLGNIEITCLEADPALGDGELVAVVHDLCQTKKVQLKEEIESLKSAIGSDAEEEEEEEEEAEVSSTGEEGEGEASDGDEDAGGDTDDDGDIVDVVLEGALRTKQELLRLLEKQDFAAMPVEDVREWYGQLLAYQKPGLIIDGQHRVKGTRGWQIVFNVVALPKAEWKELAFQFVVLNMSAKKVDDSLLINIVGNSLTDDERNAIEERLHNSGIRVPLYMGVMRLHRDENSPFKDRLKFSLTDDSGIIPAKSAKSKIITYWFNCRIYPMVKHLLEGKKKQDKKDHWVESELWFEFMTDFWNTARTRYEPHSSLWSTDLIPQTDTPASPLMRVTVIALVQKTILDFMHGTLAARIENDPTGQATWTSVLPNREKFKEYFAMFFDRLKPDFFTDWGDNAKGLDGSKSAKKNFADALVKVISNEMSIDSLKNNKKYIYGP